MIYQSWMNSALFDFNDGHGSYSIPTNLTEWLMANWQWMESQVEEFSGTDDYWAHVGLVMTQLQGEF
jgi:hypothetical protein